MEDTWYEVPEIVARTRERVPDALVKASYSSGPSYLEQTGVPASLTVGIFNSSLNDEGIEAMERVADGIAPIALAWLRDQNLAEPALTIEVSFGDGHEGGGVSWFNSLETIRFSIEEDGTLTPIKSPLPEKQGDLFRKLRYRLSGRKIK